MGGRRDGEGQDPHALRAPRERTCVSSLNLVFLPLNDAYRGLGLN